MANIILLTLGVALLVGAGVLAYRFRVRRRENKPYDLIDMGVISIVPIGILAALLIPMLAR